MTHDSEILAPNLQVITACAFIHHTFNDVEKVFWPKRADSKKFMPGVYELPGGHIDFGEDLVAGLRRELREEFTMEVNVGDPFGAFVYINNVKGSHSIEVVYFAQFIGSIDGIRLNPDDHSTYSWFSENEIEQIAGGTANDPEIRLMHKAFGLLRGDTLKF